MTEVSGALRGGWWHEYVCPVHHVELLPAGHGRYPCPHGCELTGEPWSSAWRALEHQRHARLLRSLAARAAAGDTDAGDRALDYLAGYARTYGGITSEHRGAEDWMVPGRLFAQALSESIWAASVAHAVQTLSVAVDPGRARRLAAEATPLLRGLHDTAAIARHRVELRSNYVAWFNAAGALTAGALARLGAPPPPQGWIDGPAGLYAHARAAILDDGWEWEGSTYYHAFVLLAYLYTLRGTDPADLPADVARRIVGMIGVLGDLATADGVLPALHDSPYRRPAADERVVAEHQRIEVCELAEVAALGRRFVDTDALDRLAGWCRGVLHGASDADLLEAPAGWFAGPPLPGGGPGSGATPGPVLFAHAGYAVLRPREARWLAVLDFGAHGGSHGHLDKLALYLYGDGVAWQPDPGVVPYGSRLRQDVYRTTGAHPCFSVDGEDQAECAGRLLQWTSDAEATVVVAAADDAYPGVSARRRLVLREWGLLDILELRSDRERRLALHLRPAVPVSARAAAGQWRTEWGGASGLRAQHACSVPARFETVPGWAPAHDPTRPHRWFDWTAVAAHAVFATLWQVANRPDTAAAATLELTPQAVVVHRRGATSTSYRLTLGDET